MKRNIFLAVFFLLTGLVYPQVDEFRCYCPPDYVSPFVQELNSRMSKLSTSTIQLNEVIIIAKDYGADPTLDSWFNQVIDRLPEFYDESTFGNYNYSAVVLKDDNVRAYIMPTTYTPFGDGCNDNGHVHLKSNIEYVIQQADLDHDFSDYDYNSDGVVNVHFVSIGPKSGGIANCSFSFPTNDGVTVSVDRQSRGGNQKYFFNVICHESGHYYFQFDDMDHSGLTLHDHWALGAFDVMSREGFGNIPSLFNPVARVNKGWFTPTAISSSQTNVQMQDFQKSTSNNAYVYNVPQQTFNLLDQKFYVTYHNLEGNYFYSSWPYKNVDKGGVLIWHSTTSGSEGDWRAMPVDIECAHGKYNWNITTNPVTVTNTGVKNPYYGRDSIEVRVYDTANQVYVGPYTQIVGGDMVPAGSASIFYNPDETNEFSSSSNPNSWAYIGNDDEYFQSPCSQTSPTGFKMSNIRYVSSPKSVLVDFNIQDYTINQNTTFYAYDYYFYHDLYAVPQKLDKKIG